MSEHPCPRCHGTGVVTRKPPGRPRALPDEVRQRVYALHDAGMGAGAIARLLEAEQVPTALGGKWAEGTIRALLKGR